MATVEVAIPTWNRCEGVLRTIDSAIAQSDVDGLRVVVYDNGSTDATPEAVVARYGEAVHLDRWADQQGRFRNISRPFERTDADYLLVLFDDEELLPGSLRPFVETLASVPGAAFATAQRRLRNAEGTILDGAGLQASPRFRPPDVQSGTAFIRQLFKMGDYTWICSCLFRPAVIGPTGIREADDPCDDTGLLLRAARFGPVVHHPQPVATQTDGNVGESVRMGLVDAADGRNTLSLRGCVGYQRTLERFLLEEGADLFGRRERRRLLAAAERTAAGLAGMATGGAGGAAALDAMLDAALWFRRPRSRVRLARNALRVWRGARHPTALRIGP